VFLGHEGSIFGVRISEELPTECCQKLKRVVSSCSDDRTIRVWDVSDVNTNTTASKSHDEDVGVPRTRHTGFSNEAFDAHEFSSSDCLAIGWGHLSRVWTIRFLEASPCNGSLLLQSAGEDATARTWELSPDSRDSPNLPYKLLELDCAAHHSGKNMWSSTIAHNSTGMQEVIAGGADSKITSTPLPRVLQVANNMPYGIAEYTVNDVLSWAQSTASDDAIATPVNVGKSSKKAEFFRSYCFVDETTFLLTTNSGKVLLASLSSGLNRDDTGLLSSSTLVGQPEELAGYSVCASSPHPGVAFIAGANGSIYIYRKSAATLTKLHAMGSKVGEIFAADVSESSSHNTIALLVTLVGQGKAHVLYVDSAHDMEVLKQVQVPISDHLTGSVVTSMAYLNISGKGFMAIGFRRGSIALYSVDEHEGPATLLNVIDKAHSGETVTTLRWVNPLAEPYKAQLYSAGRDGRLTVHDVDLSTGSSTLVHDLALPFGPNLEGLYLQEDRLLVHGFSSKKWYLYDVTNEEEVMSIDTGGAHRSWTYRPHLTLGGTLVWTRASSMHIYSQNGMNHTVIRSGGHGREIKALAVSLKGYTESRNRLIATGAEDTDIKIFQYINGSLICRRTLRKHTTGIQHLQWSENGDYLFSSGGCEECTFQFVTPEPR
jgi:WD40 repeat protein